MLASQKTAINARAGRGTMPGLHRTLARYSTRLARGIAALALLVGVVQGCGGAAAQQRKIIIFGWGGLPPDSLHPADMPNLPALPAAGAEFPHNPPPYPTFTLRQSDS